MPRNVGPGLAELLDRAHKKYQQGLRIETEVIKPVNRTDPDTFYYKCTVTGVRPLEENKFAEEKFTGHGEASPNEKGAKPGTPAHDTPSRMAESRAIVRALRWATNVGETAAEEMPSYGGDEPRQESRPAQTKQRSSGSENPASEPQKKFIRNLVESKLGDDWDAFTEEFGGIDELSVQDANKAINELKER